MLFSRAFIPTLREDPHSAECVSHRLLLRAAYLYMVSSGIYSYLPLGLRVLENISNCIRRQMNAQGAVECLLSALQPMEIWKKTGRDKDLEEVMLKCNDRRGRELCLGPTHEEEITEIAKKYILSYKQLPVILYQIQVKFRDEARPRFGLVRSCEFIMKDAYSFDKDEEGLTASYQKMFDAYKNIFKECGLDVVITQADPGMMGGSVSHEFMAPSEIGEDILFWCSKCEKYFNSEGRCDNCNTPLLSRRMIEVGHIFKLGTKYSSSQEAYFLDKEGVRTPFIMGCYGIGVSRIISAVVEQNHDERGIIWPRSLAPYQVILIIVDMENQTLVSSAMQLKNTLEKEGIEVLVDERVQPPGVKFNDAYLIGIPFICILGKNFLNTKKIELEVRNSPQKYSFKEEELVKFLKDDS